jgi:peptidoglycan hydrolase-like protein with peptidoglycan-binding domain
MGKKVIKLTEADIRRIVQKVISEQAQDYLKALKDAALGPGTNEKGLEELFASLKSKQDFINLDNQIKSNPWTGQAFGGQTYRSIQDVLNGELEIGDYRTAERIKNSLKKIGVDLTFKGAKNTQRPEQGTVSVEPNSFVVKVSGTVGGGKVDDKNKEQPKDTVKNIGGVRPAPTEDFIKNGRAFVESTMSGELVRKIQQALINQGYLKITKATNYFGPKTDAAVRAFQKAKGLKVDGKVGKNTYVVLFTQQAEPERKFPEEITNIPSKGLANVTQGIQTPPQITRQGNIQTVTY